MLRRHLVTRIISGGEDDAHVVVDEDEIVFVTSHFVHNVVHAYIPVQDVCFVSQVMEACEYEKIVNSMNLDIYV